MHGAVGAARKLNLAAEEDFRLGALLVRPSLCRVGEGASAFRVEPRVMEVLIVLHRAQGGTVTREQLIEACWGGRSVSDDAITRVIAKLRQLATGPDGRPNFRLQTLPKVGYRLDVEPASGDAADTARRPADIDEGTEANALPPARRDASPFRIASGRAVVAIAAAAILFALALWFPRAPAPPPAPSASANAVRLTQAARALIHERNRLSVAEAGRLLRQAIADDPNYAPAWARLAHATYFAWWYAEQNEPGAKLRLKAESLGYINRALAISPRSAEALAIMGMIQGDTQQGLPWLERAVRLDPDSAEAWLWLAAAKRDHGDLKGALAGFEKAHALDPAWSYSARSYVEIVFRMRGAAEAYRELDRAARDINDQNWALQERADLAYDEGRLAASAAFAAAALRAHPQNPFWARDRLVSIATLLGDDSLAARLLSRDAALRSNYNAMRKTGWAFERARTSPETWWDATHIDAQALQLVVEDRSATLVRLYDERFKGPMDYLLRCPTFCDSIAAAPSVILALRRMHRPADAGRILAGAAKEIGRLESGGDLSLVTEIERARLAALAGDAGTAKGRLRDAVKRGWKGQDSAGADPATDPAFENLRDDAEFRAIVSEFRQSRKSEAMKLAKVDLSGLD
jgi:DNA-binding winged helix-turn-helix (wHTH) protein